ncbi:hypothetical protein [Paenibacillus xerothermodurans]|uniref:hypothetical protein n=1 Tax=Paenibacillus xerothermodurans TaxID=1977292 RepID=UPI001FB2DE65|nr:hypothetical protein [Paenibacillus xerothermodurans]
MSRAVVSGTGGYVPDKILTNADLERLSRRWTDYTDAQPVLFSPTGLAPSYCQLMIPPIRLES